MGLVLELQEFLADSRTVVSHGRCQMASKTKRTIIILAFVPVMFGAAIVFYATVLTDSSGQPYCHKVLDTAIYNWQDANNSQSFPNVGGDSVRSLGELTPHLGGDDLTNQNMYVPGLTRNDPGELILMYLPAPTRWTWHGQKPTIFTDRAWLVVPVDMKFYGNRSEAGPGEFSERLSTTDFKRRLQATLQFLKEEQRPNWKATVEQHTEFLTGSVEPHAL